MKKKQEIKIVISGPQGCGKTTIVGLLTVCLRSFGQCEVVTENDHVVSDETLTRLLSDKRIVIETTNL
jgi:uridine kinase